MEQEKGADPLDLEDMEPWRDLFCQWPGAYFLRSYLGTGKDASFIPTFSRYATSQSSHPIWQIECENVPQYLPQYTLL